MRQRDFLALQETHSATGRSHCFRGGPDVTPFWSHGISTRTAGVALWVRQSFLQQFHPVTLDSCQEIAPGRAAVLRLAGFLGDLDIYTMCMPSGGERPAREGLAHRIATTLRPQSQALSLMLGDWDFVVDPKQRFSRAPAEWTGSPDNAEAEAFADLFGKTHHFHELEQDGFTHASARGISRLNRAYSNHHFMDQVDREWGCAALSLVKTLSNHRAVSFFRRSRIPNGDGEKPIDPATLRHPDWKHRTPMEFIHLVSQEGQRPESLRKFVLFKDAMARVADRPKFDKVGRQATSFQEQFGATMAFIWAAEQRRVPAMVAISACYKHLQSSFNLQDPSSWSLAAFIALQEHAVELGRKALLYDLRAFHGRRADKEPHKARAVKDRLHSRLRRMAPGGTCSLKAVQLAGGAITTDPATIAKSFPWNSSRTSWKNGSATDSRKKNACRLRPTRLGSSLARMLQQPSDHLVTPWRAQTDSPKKRGDNWETQPSTHCLRPGRQWKSAISQPGLGKLKDCPPWATLV